MQPTKMVEDGFRISECHVLTLELFYTATSVFLEYWKHRGTNNDMCNISNILFF